MKLKLKLLTAMIPLWGFIHGQEVNADRLQSFLNTVSGSNVAAETIISDYICTMPAQTDGSAKKLYSLVVERINGLRKQMQSMDNKNFVINKYKELPPSEQNLILKEETADDVYVVKINNKDLISVLFKENRIASFITLNKGRNSVFLLYCP